MMWTTIRSVGFALALGIAIAPVVSPRVRAEEGGKIKILLVTGGHAYEKEADFHSIFEKDPGVEFHHQDHEKGPSKPLETIASAAIESFDAIVLYDMWQPITDAQKEAFAKRVRGGKGLLVLHHALADFQDWPEFRRMIGGRYFTGTHREGDVERPASTYQHDVDMKVEIADRDHFITRGLSDFTIHDEAYGGFAVDPAAHVLLRAHHPQSGPIVGWTRPYGKGRVAVIQLGHDSAAYKDANYETLVRRAIRWVVRRTPEDLASRSLFDGKSLVGWAAEGDASFTVEGGMLVGKQGPGDAAGDIFTTAEFGDFDCEATWAMEWPGNSGLWFRYVDAGKAYQADILEWKDPVCWAGSVYCPGKMFIAMNQDPAIVARDGWNTLRVRAEGDHILVFLNGNKVADVRDSSSRSGKFGLQVHAGADFKAMAIRLADLRVRPLGGATSSGR